MAQVQTSEPTPLDEVLGTIRAMKPSKGAIEDLASVVANDPYQEPRVCAIETAGCHLRRLAVQWHGPGTNPHRWNLIRSYLELLLSWLPTEQLRWYSLFRLKREQLVLRSLKEAAFPVIRPEDLRTEHLQSLWHILKYSESLPGQEGGEVAHGYAVKFWTGFLKNEKGVLGIKPQTLLSPKLEGVASESRKLLDRVCAWLADDEGNDDLLYLVRKYGWDKTLVVVQRRFWGMVLGVSGHVGPGEEELFLNDPAGWALANAPRRLSNRVFTSYHVLVSRLVPNWQVGLYQPPDWVRGTKTWKRLRRRACLEK